MVWSVFMLNCAVCFICGSLKRIKWLEVWWDEFSVKWDVMLHRGFPVPQAVLLDFTDSCLPPNHLLSAFSLSFACSLSLPPPGENLRVHLITSIFRWLSFLWIKPCWEFAVLNYTIVINEVWAPTLQSSSCWSPPERRVPYQRHCFSPTSVSSSAVVSLHLQLHIYI